MTFNDASRGRCLHDLVFIHQFLDGVGNVLDPFTFVVNNNKKPECVFPQGQSSLGVQLASSKWVSSTNFCVGFLEVKSLSIKWAADEQERLFGFVDGMAVFVPFENGLP